MDYKEKVIALLNSQDLSNEQKEKLERIFPELAESEDERIRKALIRFHKSTIDVDGIKGEKIIAWLEKQSTPQVRTGLEWVNTIDDACDKRYLEEYAHGEYCHEQSFKWGFQEGVDWLEKQDEQKPADKVEPKFHKGEWIVHHGTENIYQVVAVIDNQYQLKYGDTYTIQKCADVDRCARLWDFTKDAKDGDVLFTSSTASYETFIFKSIDEKGNAKCYFAYDSEDGFREGKYHFIGSAINCKPATKEQYDTLIKAMTDRGYTFDFEKKELKKIEQSPIDVRTTGYWHEEEEEQKPAWNDDALRVMNKELESWLKSHKDRIQLKQEWSEEDNRLINEVIELIDAGSLDREEKDDYIERLKSLRPQSHWKPTEEQIKAVKEALSLAKNCGEESAFDLRTLYEQLKKLREE